MTSKPPLTSKATTSTAELLPRSAQPYGPSSAVVHALLPAELQPFLAEDTHLADLMLLDIKSVSVLVGLKETSIYDRVRDGTFPEPLRLGTRYTRWRAGAIKEWLLAQEAQQTDDIKQRLQERAKKGSDKAKEKKAKGMAADVATNAEKLGDSGEEASGEEAV